jgi:hypothetical protein
MHRFNTPALLASCALLAGAAGPALAATPGYLETWDNPDDQAGWFGSTTDSTVVNPGFGGNPGGFLEVRRAGDFAIGATTALPDVAGSYAGRQWTISFDTAQIDGDVSDLWLRFRFQDSTFNGWRYHFDAPAGDGWTSHSVTFDATWSDVQAQLNGWENEADLGLPPTVSFAQTLGNAYHPEVRFEGSRTLLVGVDNFAIAGAVPEPSTYALAAVGLAMLGVAVRRRQRS